MFLCHLLLLKHGSNERYFCFFSEYKHNGSNE